MIETPNCLIAWGNALYEYAQLRMVLRNTSTGDSQTTTATTTTTTMTAPTTTSGSEFGYGIIRAKDGPGKMSGTNIIAAMHLLSEAIDKYRECLGLGGEGIFFAHPLRNWGRALSSLCNLGMPSSLSSLFVVTFVVTYDSFQMDHGKGQDMAHLWKVKISL